MTSEEKQLQLRKISQLDKIIVRLEWIIILMCIFTVVISFMIYLASGRY